MKEAEIRKITVPGQPRPKKKKKKFVRSPSQCPPAILMTAGSIKQEFHSPGWPGQKARPYIKKKKKSSKGLKAWLKG
jgi:hypothetical protein